MDNALLNEFKQNAIFRLKEGQRMLHLAFDKVEEKDVWAIPSENGNSLGNQILHSCGNMTQYILSSLGGIQDKRVREKEFSTRSGFTKRALLSLLDKTIAEAIATIENAPEATWLSFRKVQGFDLSGLGAVLHAVEHFSYHVGQVAFWIKQLTTEDLSFYADQDLTQLNE